MALSRSASTRSLPSQRRKELTCPVCQEIFKTPKILSCFHSFCQSCLERLSAIHGSFFPCPSCRKRTWVPAGGVCKFQNNFYITEGDLERARKGVDSSICLIHSLHEEPLAFFCVQCDEAICIRCKLTKHENHKTEDLTEAAERCKRLLHEARPRLDDAVKHLHVSLTKAQQNGKAAEAKRIHIKEQINVQRDMLIAMVTQRCGAAVHEVDTISDAVYRHLNSEEAHLQLGLHDLEKLQDRLDHAVNDSSDVDVLDMEREMREGKGTPELLSQVMRQNPNKTVRVGLDCDTSFVKVDDIRGFIGKPLQLKTANVTVKEEITKVVRCGKEGDGREVHALFALESERVHVAYGGTAPEYADEKKVSIDVTFGISSEPQSNYGRLTYKKYQKGKLFTSSVQFDSGNNMNVRYNSKSTSSLQVKFSAQTGICDVHRITVSSDSPFYTEPNRMCSLAVTDRTPYAFDVSSDEQTFALVQSVEKTEGRPSLETPSPAKRSTPAQTLTGQQTSPAVQVNVFQRRQRDHVATYSPPETDLPFFPRDVCFWRPSPHEEEKLLVADYANDCIHVVGLEAGVCRFERFLAAGSGDLVKPTAFDTDGQRLWIGCGNGWVLKCEAVKH